LSPLNLRRRWVGLRDSDSIVSREVEVFRSGLRVHGEAIQHQLAVYTVPKGVDVMLRHEPSGMRAKIPSAVAPP
jgi:hypothetical protein